VNINVCEHPEPVRELRRIYDTASETLGFRTLEQPIGRDVLQLKIMLHALGLYRAGDKEIDARSPQANVYTQEAVDAVDKFRAAQGWQTTVPGFVDARTIDRLWIRLREAGQTDAIRRRLLELQRVR
jgi:murein L,D-transpeptidase YcbB/YkuD